METRHAGWALHLMRRGVMMDLSAPLEVLMALEPAAGSIYCQNCGSSYELGVDHPGMFYFEGTGVVRGDYATPDQVAAAGAMTFCPACPDISKSDIAKTGTRFRDVFFSGDDRSVKADVDKGARFEGSPDVINKPFND